MKKKQTNYPNLKAIAVLAILLIAAPSGWAQYVDCDVDAHLVNGTDINCGEGTTHIIDTPIDGLNVWPDTTVNLYASVQYVFVAQGGILNVYAGSIGWLIVGTGVPDASVTVYGTDFKVDWERNDIFVSLEGATEFTPLSTPTYDSGSVLRATDENGITMNLLCFSDTPIQLSSPVSEYIEVVIDIKPGNNTNSINLKSRGVVPVAVLTTKDFDASTINPETVTFAGALPVRSRLCGVDDDCDDDDDEEGDDGDKNMLFFFKTQQLNLDENSTEATLTGETKDGEKIAGIDKVHIVSWKKAKHDFSNRFNSKHKRPRWNRKDR